MVLSWVVLHRQPGGQSFITCVSCLDRGKLGQNLSSILFWGGIACLVGETSLFAQLAPGAHMLTDGRNVLRTPGRVIS